MSMVFEVLPTIHKIPACEEIILHSGHLFNDYLMKHGIKLEIDVISKENDLSGPKSSNPLYLVSDENSYSVFELNGEGEVYVFFNKSSELDEECWNEEIKHNKNAKALIKEVEANKKLGYSWMVKRTAGQSAIVNLYYVFLAISIAVSTAGIIYSDDGAWEYSKLPMSGERFISEYLNADYVEDTKLKEWVEKQLKIVKERINI